ncbi:MAG: SDR family oxidoreductase [Pseudomonadota bacterium]
MARQHDYQTVLITGASAGIGSELAKVFAAHDFDLVLVARSKDKMQKLAREIKTTHGVEVTVIAMDLLGQGAAQELYETVQEENLSIDVLVNNAGLLSFGGFKDMALEEIENIIQLNLMVLTQLTHLFIQDMVAQGAGKILNVASLGGFQPVPSLAAYAAGKAYVLSLTEALSEELRGTGVTLTALCPGLTDTDMVHSAETNSNLAAPSVFLMTPEEVARDGYKACMSGQVIKVPGLANQASANWVRMQPRWLVRRLGGLFARQVI